MFGDIFQGITGLFGKWMDADASQKNTAATNAANMAINEKNIALQKEFAQHGLSWKIDDAGSKGIHPLIALGAQGQSFSPQSVALQTPETDFGGMGQDIGRAVKAALASEDREKADSAEARKLALEKGSLENDILRAELVSKVNRTGRASGQVGPSMPSSIARGDVSVPMPRPGPVRTAGGYAVKEDDIKQAADDIPAQAVIRPVGVPLSTNPYLSDAQKLEDRYGEALSDYIFGPGNFVGDIGYTGYKMLPDYVKSARPHRPSAHEMRWRRRY